ncbi:hypothetical protein [Bacillus sp. FJAT-45350]|uniref:hypothetical protein n=1 Tax=Bacillus sp. FJAT-45350 TaxID=2011014 RepID=UPI000BB6ECC3|nr:hypothetical protein [Bacillus sp. FJAT-45350]
MNSKDRNLLSIGASGSFLFISMYLYMTFLESNNFFILLAIIISTPLLQKVIYNIIPKDKNEQETKSK